MYRQAGNRMHQISQLVTNGRRGTGGCGLIPDVRTRRLDWQGRQADDRSDANDNGRDGEAEINGADRWSGRAGRRSRLGRRRRRSSGGFGGGWGVGWSCNGRARGGRRGRRNRHGLLCGRCTRRGNLDGRPTSRLGRKTDANRLLLLGLSGFCGFSTAWSGRNGRNGRNGCVLGHKSVAQT